MDPKKAANALEWAVKRDGARYDLLAEDGVRDITGYNAAFEAGELEPRGASQADRRPRAAAATVRAQRLPSGCPSSSSWSTSSTTS